MSAIHWTVPSPTHEEAMSRYRREIEACASFDPPLKSGGSYEQIRS